MSEQSLNLRSAEDCEFDILSLGEVMLRLDPGSGRVRTARQFQAWEGGGEYNVARGLSCCFGLRAALASALVDNEVGQLIAELVRSGGVDSSNVVWQSFDGIGHLARNGLNFTERGFGVRAAKGTSDRGHTAASQLKPGMIDWQEVFGRRGVRWFHTGGIFAGLSDTTADVIHEAVLMARRHGTVVSYDLNYRPSLWQRYGGLEQCRKVNRAIASSIDVMIGNEEDFTCCLGLEVEGVGQNLDQLPVEGFARMIDQVVDKYPNLQVVATTLRSVKTASRNDWSAIAWQNHQMVQSRQYADLEILDRVGGGDSFASGLIYGFLSGAGIATAVEWGAAHGALAMTTPGDTSMASFSEVDALARGDLARIKR